MLMIGEAVTIIYDSLDDLHRKLDALQQTEDTMAVDQATFDAALSAFMTDLNNGLAAIQAKLDASGAQVDLSAELSQIQNAQAAFDAQVSADTAAAPGGAPTTGAETATQNAPGAASAVDDGSQDTPA